jgi:hypothetical protein
MARTAARTASCGDAEARKRLDDARAQFELADASAAEGATPAERNAAVSSAVLAGIAAADAACCKALGRASRSQNHKDAQDLLEQVTPGGDKLAERSVGYWQSRPRANMGSRHCPRIRRRPRYAELAN